MTNNKIEKPKNQSPKNINSSAKLDPWAYDDSDNWTPEQAASYAAWMENMKARQLDFNKKLRKKATPRRMPKASKLEVEILAGLSNAITFADLARGHAEIFDEVGFLYDCDEFIAHAKLVSDYIKKYRELFDLEEAKS